MQGDCESVLSCEEHLREEGVFHLEMDGSDLEESMIFLGLALSGPCCGKAQNVELLYALAWDWCYGSCSV